MGEPSRLVIQSWIVDVMTWSLLIVRNPSTLSSSSSSSSCIAMYSRISRSIVTQRHVSAYCRSSCISVYHRRPIVLGSSLEDREIPDRSPKLDCLEISPCALPFFRWKYLPISAIRVGLPLNHRTETSIATSSPIPSNSRGLTGDDSTRTSSQDARLRSSTPPAALHGVATCSSVFCRSLPCSNVLSTKNQRPKTSHSARAGWR